MVSQISSIQLSQKTKQRLKSLKKTPSESYESVITRVLSQEKTLHQKLKEGYISQYDDLKKLNEEWSSADSSW